MDYKQPSLLATVFLLILGAGIFYFLDKPLMDNSENLNKKISELSGQKRLQEEHAMKIGQIGLDIKSSEWESKKKKMEVNFTSSPFYVPKMEKFFTDLVSRSGMTVGSLSVQVGSVGSVQPVSSSAKNPSEQPSAVNVGQSSVSGVKGPVRRNSFTVSATGTYEELKSLVAIFEKQACLISVKKIDFGEASEGKFNFNITGEVYSY